MSAHWVSTFIEIYIPIEIASLNFSDFPFSFQIFQKCITALCYILISLIKISGIPRVRNIPVRACKAQKLIHLPVRISLQHPVKILNIPLIHTDNVIGILIILPRNLLRPVRNQRNIHFTQFIHSPPVRRIPNLLPAGRKTINIKPVRQSQGFYLVGEYTFGQGGTAYFPYQMVQSLFLLYLPHSVHLHYTLP